ncbi:MAG TPA: hypothetical protein VG738_01035 [Chitinophagaceae bacterium]|nr:hypothetical protein [Chitinophagaceae bacterium]
MVFKRIITVTGYLVLMFTAFAQSDGNDNAGTLKNTYANPLGKFDSIIKISERNFLVSGGAIDSTSVITLLQIAREEKNDSLLAISYNWIGSYLAFEKGDNTAALEYYFKAIPLAENAKDKRRVSSLYFDIALIYFTLQDNSKAVENVKKGGSNLPATSSPMYNYMVVQYQRNMAQYYLLVHQPDSALHYAQATLETSHLLKSTAFTYGALYLSATAYTQEGDAEMAEIYFKKANALNDSIKINSSKLPLYTNYAAFLLSQKKLPEALTLSRSLLAMGLAENNNNIKLAADSLLRRVFEAMHNIDSAYYYARMEAKVNGFIFSQDNINKVQALAFNEHLRRIEEQAKQQEDNERRKENIQYALMALGIITLLVVYLLLSRRFITNARVIEFFGIIALLLVFEFLNLVLHPFLESVTNHTPAIMLLALVTIAAILVPLHHRLEKWLTHKLVEKNKQVRLAAAKRTIEKLAPKEEPK